MIFRLEFGLCLRFRGHVLGSIHYPQVGLFVGPLYDLQVNVGGGRFCTTYTSCFSKYIYDLHVSCFVYVCDLQLLFGASVNDLRVIFGVYPQSRDYVLGGCVRSIGHFCGSIHDLQVMFKNSIYDLQLIFWGVCLRSTGQPFLGGGGLFTIYRSVFGGPVCGL